MRIVVSHADVNGQTSSPVHVWDHYSLEFTKARKKGDHFLWEFHKTHQKGAISR